MIQSKILLNSVDNIKETLNDNYFVVIVEGSCFIGTALNIRAILSDSPARSTGEEIGSTILFFAIVSKFYYPKPTIKKISSLTPFRLYTLRFTGTNYNDHLCKIISSNNTI